ncbi:hypothetical protein NG796_01485 [Laspinema sp. A4]|uniref:hypothetical protein n=1 Tax=Laspinema sp. D2d TaxID=2953686 RepID=UPI0021BAE8E6|nr:hypothetical protein [Laspinema sp. D2d]MCT7981959.1 hypothetical protein [Laspinema sp. D2d]
MLPSPKQPPRHGISGVGITDSLGDRLRLSIASVPSTSGFLLIYSAIHGPRPLSLSLRSPLGSIGVWHEYP